MKIGAVAFSIAAAGLVSTAGMGIASAAPDESGGQSSSSPSESSGSSSTNESGGSSTGGTTATSGTDSTTGSHTSTGHTATAGGTGAGPTSTVSAGGTAIVRPTHGSGDEPATTSPTSSLSESTPSGGGTPSVTPSSAIDRDPSTPRSDRRATESAADGPRRIRVTPAVGSSAPSDDGSRNPVRPTSAAAPDQSADPAPAVSSDPVGSPSPQPASITVDPVAPPVAVATPAEPVATVTPVTVVSDLLSAVGLGLPLSANDGPAPSQAVDVMGSLVLVRRDLEQVADVDAAKDDRETATTNSLVIDPASGNGTSGSASATATQPAASTAAERAAAFTTAQSERIAAFTTAQQARLSELQQQIAQSPLSAIISIPVFAVTEAVRTVVFAVSEVIHTAVFAVSEVFHALSDALNPGTVGGGGSTIYGDPVKNEKWFQAQDGPNTCVLMSSAMIIGQLTGTMPTEAEMVAEASSSPSVVDPTKKMYEGPQVSGVDVKDAVALLDRHGVTATILTYEKSEGAKALNAMAAALGDNKAVMVGVHGATVWNAVEQEPMPQGERSADHQIVVIGYDSAKELVYINDSGFGLKGQNFSVPLDAFMKAWEADNFETTVAVLKVQPQDVQSPASTNLNITGTLVTVA